jgi:DNA invertase Pin-like site-specific DNA recombinase
LAVFAKFERKIIRERVQAGLEHARQNGRRLGRPNIRATDSERHDWTLNGPRHPNVPRSTNACRKLTEQGPLTPDEMSYMQQFGDAVHQAHKRFM